MVLFVCFSWSFGIQLTWISEEGLPLFKEEGVQNFPPVTFGRKPPFAATGRLFASGYLVFKQISGHL